MLEVYHQEYNNLKIFPEDGLLERHIGLLDDLGVDLNLQTLRVLGNQVFVSKKCSEIFQICNDTKNTDIVEVTDIIYITDNSVYNTEDFKDNLKQLLQQNLPQWNSRKGKLPVILAPTNSIFETENIYTHIYNLSKIEYDEVFKQEEMNGNITQIPFSLYIPDSLFRSFYNHFHCYIPNIETRDFHYDNLINLCIMVKDAGELFEKVLTENLPYIDRWTILDTGSTDNTIETVLDVLRTKGNKKGNLYQEPFINFRDSRNRCLELAGKKCKFNVMLDDTYVIQGKFREFLNTVRGDHFSDSFSFYIKSDDVEYCSNRVTKSEKELKYIYKIHEVIQKENNKNVIIPSVCSFIKDYRSQYMENRTLNRKEKDLVFLFEELEENPEDPRSLYYIAQTYSCLNQPEKTLEYFLKRVEHKEEGFFQEKVDALFEATRIMNFELNYPWEECEKNYLKCYEMEKNRPECLYFLGIHYIDTDRKKAFEYLKKAFEIGYPENKQYSLKPSISFYFVPRFLAQLSYEYNDFILGEKVCELFISHADQMKKLMNEDFKNSDLVLMREWNDIFKSLNKLNLTNNNKLIPKQKIVCIIADGGFSEWTGKDILDKGVGGSETWVIEMVRYMSVIRSDYKFVVFCKTNEIDTFEGVDYVPLNSMYGFFSTTSIHMCIISRFSHYIPTAIEAGIENIHLVLHDLIPSGSIIPVHPYIKKIICLTQWHKEYFLKIFPQFTDITDGFHYGINNDVFEEGETVEKVPNSFIYSSFPNRGLIILLKMWKQIRVILPDATLNIYCDLYGSGSQGKWVNYYFPEEMEEIRELLKGLEGIFYHGWVSKEKLAIAWKSADIWFYPCKFAETFCLTALESATSKTLVITNNLAALQDTVGNRGCVISGDASTLEWQENALKVLEFIQKPENKQYKDECINRNYQWSQEHHWKTRAELYFKKYIQEELEEKYVDGKDIEENIQKDISIITQLTEFPTMNILLFLSGHRQNEEYKLSALFFERCPNFVKMCDLYINNNCLDNDISKNVEYLKMFKNVKINNNNKNAGYVNGAIQSVSNLIEDEKLLHSNYDYVIHIHPDIFMTNENTLLELLHNELNNEETFIVNKYLVNNSSFFSFDFFIFKPKKLQENIFNQWTTYNGFAEHYIYNAITSNNISYKLIKRFDDDNWFPRRIDLLGLWHEHDLEKVKKYLIKSFVDRVI
jgi:glycosyltransferase involved in cell wall biosynthesis